VSGGKPGVDRDGAVKTGQRLLVPAESAQRHAEKPVCARMTRIDRERLVRERDAVGEAALPASGARKLIVPISFIGVRRMAHAFA
jgi:hypothetical protein